LNLAAANSSALTSSIIANSDANSQTASQGALTKINSAITTLSSARGTLGAVGSRLNSAVNNLSVMKENFAAAESRIRDIDVAETTAEFSRVQILREVGSAMLAHSKQDSQLVLRLLS
jgi:flagellin